MRTSHKYLRLKKLSGHYTPTPQKVMLKESDKEYLPVFWVQTPFPNELSTNQLHSWWSHWLLLHTGVKTMPVIPPVLRGRALQWSELCQRAVNTGWAQTSISQKLSLCICMCFYLRALVRGHKMRSFFKFSFLTERPAPKYKRCTPRGGPHLYERPIYSVYLYSG